ncbi:MAG: GspE/PulE family protein [Gammaproteobacteria bacterium]|nr:GspE/PulE family protein [Gammaproteobacteria bacterium]
MLDVYVRTQDAPGLVDGCLLFASRSQASDLHVEPQTLGWQVRQRVDGLLQPLVFLPLALGKAVIVRVKLLAKLDIGEQRKPQDGSFQTTINQNQLDIRCSFLPGYLGEKLVMRIQNRSQGILALADLGMSLRQLRVLQEHLQAPQGMVLVTGPTGAGKSITLYAALQNLLQPHLNVMSVEDPVEMVMLGMHQVAPAPNIGITFSSVLRALLRQDPDVIMLGELRDAESADMAIKAAQTGHLLLTSMHTNTALEAISRCFGLGVDLQGLSYCLQLVINQRLLRRLCDNCKKPLSKGQLDAAKSPTWHQVEAECGDEFGPFAPAQAVGCSQCYGGYKGRLGVFEIWPITAWQRAQIEQGQQPAKIEYAKCYQQTTICHSIYEQGIARVMAGHTGLEELKRVLV